MDRRTLAVLAVAALAVFAIGFSAATLPSTIDSGGGGGDEDGGEPPPPDSDTEVDSSGSETASFLLDLLLALAALFLLGVYLYLVIHRPRVAIALLILTLVIAAALGALSLFDLEPEFDEESEGPDEDGTGSAAEDGEGEGGGEGEGDGEGSSSVDTSLVLVAVLLAVLLLGAVVVLYRGGDETGAEDGEDPDGGVDSTTIGAIAGRAADRIEEDNKAGTDAENEVYRAWQEMTARLETDSGETTTPREFQQLAVDTGMRPDDVRELTELFERVRYGGKDATEDREQRAVRVLRRVESTYGETE